MLQLLRLAYAYLTGERRRQREAQLLAYLADHPDAWSLQICHALGWGPGTFYPLVDRLEEQRRVIARRDDTTSPPRRRYHVNPWKDPRR